MSFPSLSLRRISCDNSLLCQARRFYRFSDLCRHLNYSGERVFHHLWNFIGKECGNFSSLQARATNPLKDESLTNKEMILKIERLRKKKNLLQNLAANSAASLGEKKNSQFLIEKLENELNEWETILRKRGIELSKPGDTFKGAMDKNLFQTIILFGFVMSCMTTQEQALDLIEAHLSIAFPVLVVGAFTTHPPHPALVACFFASMCLSFPLCGIYNVTAYAMQKIYSRSL